MDYHKNAPWTAVSPERLARMVIEDGLRVSAAALCFSVSAKTAAKSAVAQSFAWMQEPQIPRLRTSQRRSCSARDDSFGFAIFVGQGRGGRGFFGDAHDPASV